MPPTRRPLGFVVLAVFVAWYAIGCAALALHFLWRAEPARRSPATGACALAAAALGAWAADAVWRARPAAPRAVALWGAGVIATFVALFLALDPLPDGTRPWGALAAGCALFAAITAGLARYVRLRLGAIGA